MSKTRKRSKGKQPRRVISNRISDHFSKKDFECRCGQCNRAIRVSLGLVGGLELLRFKLRKRIEILKGFQCPDSQSGSVKFNRNYHTVGVAADIQVQDMDIFTVFKEAETVPEFRGLGLNLDENTVHVDTRKDKEPFRYVVEKSKRIELTADNYQRYLSPTSLESPE